MPHPGPFAFSVPSMLKGCLADAALSTCERLKTFSGLTAVFWLGYLEWKAVHSHKGAVQQRLGLPPKTVQRGYSRFQTLPCPQQRMSPDNGRTCASMFSLFRCPTCDKSARGRQQMIAKRPVTKLGNGADLALRNCAGSAMVISYPYNQWAADPHHSISDDHSCQQTG